MGLRKISSKRQGFLAKSVYSSNVSTASIDGTGEKNGQNYQIF
jgi:hypothetical protein